MGTINHKSSDFITLASPDYNPIDFESDPDFLEEYRKEIETTGLSETVYRVIDDYIEADAENVRCILNRYNFEYFKIEIEPGYYEGFSLQINLDPDTIHDSSDKRLAQKEITKIRTFLHECAGCGMQAHWPGWCPKYFNHSETITMIREAIKKMRESVRKAETDYTWMHKRKAS